ncbi:MAG: hypothetical protein JO372_20760 [Solirubrobacterales bacterium]|nr:hypothetical protein [Solirubrobacterales bacterium]
MSLASRSRLIAATLMIGAIAAPAASAQFDLAPAGTPSGRAQSQATTGAPVARPNPDQQTARTGPVGPPILRRPRASELPAINRAQAQEADRLAYNPPRTARYSNTEMNAYASAAHPVAAPTPISNAPSNGFDYGAAALGAGITGAIVLLITASTLTIRRRSQVRHP